MHITADMVVNGNNFKALCDFVFQQDGIPARDATIFCCNNHLRELMDCIAQNGSHTYTVIAHNGDVNVCCVPMKRRDFVWRNIPVNLTMLYAQNCDVNDARICPIPIGLENVERSRIQKTQHILALRQMDMAKGGLLYVNHKSSTNLKERQSLYGMFDWSTQASGMPFDKYIHDVATHKFMLCPPGNGIDTHRLAECLYLRTIPIVKKYVCNLRFAHYFPILFVDTYDDITLDILTTAYDVLRRQWNATPNLLHMDFWAQLIRSRQTI